MIPNPIRPFVVVAVAVLGVIAILLVVGYCSEREKAREAKAGETVAEGRTVSAVEAIKEIGELGERSDATDIEVRQAQEAVRNAAPEDRDMRARYELCRLQSRPACDRLLVSGPHPADNAN